MPVGVDPPDSAGCVLALRPPPGAVIRVGLAAVLAVALPGRVGTQRPAPVGPPGLIRLGPAVVDLLLGRIFRLRNDGILTKLEQQVIRTKGPG